MTLRFIGKYSVLSLALVPAFFVMGHLGPKGFPEAQSCLGPPSPGAGVAPPQTATIHRNDQNAVNVPVASDGFFLIDQYTPCEPLAVTVVVTTPAGEPVAGTVKLLKSSGSCVSTYSWSADQPLAVGTQLKATVAANAAYGTDQATLEVVGPPAELVAGIMSVHSWYDAAHGIGPLVSCTIDGSKCAPSTMMVPSAEEMLHAVHYGWVPGTTINGSVAWEIRVDRADRAADDAELPAPSPILFTGPPQAPILNGLTFPKDTTSFCATYTVRDLRTDREQSAEVCSTVGPSTELQRDYPLDSCTSPPSAELTEVWCKTHLGSSVQECLPYDPTVKPADPKPQPDDPNLDPMPQVDDRGDGSGSRTSSGCQMSSGMSHGPSFALFLAAVMLGGLVRRRRGAR